MRGRLIPLLLALSSIGVSGEAAAAQTPPVGGDAGGTDRQASGGLLSEGGEVVVAERRDGGENAGSGGGGSSDCHWAGIDGSRFDPYTYDSGGAQVEFALVCRNEAGSYVFSSRYAVLPLAAAEPVDPQALAELARAQLRLPLPDVAFSPPLDDGDDFLLVGLETWLWVENWRPASRSASAGGVTATVTATPIRQEWDFAPGVADPELEGGCDSGGAAWDPGRPPEAQSSECTFTFTHSSAGRPEPHGDAYEGHLTVIHELSWTSNVGAGGTLGTVRRTTVVPVRVGEQQALNESGGTQQ